MALPSLVRAKPTARGSVHQAYGWQIAQYLGTIFKGRYLLPGGLRTLITDLENLEEMDKPLDAYDYLN